MSSQQCVIHIRIGYDTSIVFVCLDDCLCQSVLLQLKVHEEKHVKLMNCEIDLQWNGKQMIPHSLSYLSASASVLQLSTYCSHCLSLPPPLPKVMPSMASSRKHTSKALRSSRATRLNSSTQVNRATHHSSRVMVSFLGAMHFSCRRHYWLSWAVL